MLRKHENRADNIQLIEMEIDNLYILYCKCHFIMKRKMLFLLFCSIKHLLITYNVICKS